MTGTQLRERRQKMGLSQAKLAEISGVSQHLLSAYELGKCDLTATFSDKFSAALSNKVQVEKLAKRIKRYQRHKYVEIKKHPNRVEKASRTKSNIEYLDLLNDIAVLHDKKKDGNLSALSLFSGCGGFSLGFSAAGFLIKGFLELEKPLRKTYKKNFSHSIELGGDIASVTSDSLQQYSKKLGSIDVIIGGPPCQGFSLAGKRQITDPRNVLFKHYLRFVDAFAPKIAILENVRLLTSMKSPSGGFIKDEIVNEFQRHGYNIRLFEINAKNYGVPQHRERAIFVAVRKDIKQPPSLPNTTFGEREDMFSSFSPFRTFADACSDLPFIESGEKSNDPLHEAVEHPYHVIEWLWDVPEGRSAHDNKDESKRPPSGYNTTYKRQVWNEPASTVQTTFGMISGCRNVHPIATRSLTIREAARIQSFPDSFQFTGNLGIIRKGIGNAVPPLLAYALALHLKKILSDFVEIPRF